MPNNTSQLDRLLKKLDLQHLEEDLFVGRAGPKTATDTPRIFGGLVIAQSIVAAGRSSAQGQIHSLQQVFMRPGDPTVDLVYRVTRLFQGRTFASVYVQVEQNDKPISQAMIGLVADAQGGPSHQAPMPTVAPLDSCVNRDQLRGREDWDKFPIELRVHPDDYAATEPHIDMWMQARGDVPDDQLIHKALLGYATDRGLISTAWMAHGSDGAHKGATLDHSMWFHRDLDMSAWHMHSVDSPAFNDARALMLGAVYSHDGQRVASTAQQGMLRSR